MDDARVRALAQQVLDDPGSYSPVQRFPNSGLEHGVVPVWNAKTKTWQSGAAANADHATNADNSTTVGGLAPSAFLQHGKDITYGRWQGNASGWITDNNYRQYVWGGSPAPSTVYQQDPQSYFSAFSGIVQINKACTCIVQLQMTSPSAGNYAMKCQPMYNGTSIDPIAGGAFDVSHNATDVSASAGGWTIHQFAANDFIQPTGWCNSGVPVFVLDLIVLPT